MSARPVMDMEDDEDRRHNRGIYAVGTQHIQREVTVEHKLQIATALLTLLLDRQGGTVEFTPFEIATRMMYPKEFEDKVRPSDGTFIITATPYPEPVGKVTRR